MRGQSCFSRNGLFPLIQQNTASFTLESHAKLACSKCGAMQIVLGKQNCKLKKPFRQCPQQQSQQYADAMLIQEKSF